MERQDTKEPLVFYINGKEYKITEPFEASYTLAEFLRDDAALKGTKVMCKEGGCGACVVTVTHFDQSRGKEITYAINSCLAPLYGMHGWKVTTVEGLGDSRQGYHQIQQRVADMNGSQCGYCTPGMVMSIYGALCNKDKPSQRSLERALDGNLCRCTGYRPIHDAAKSFAADNPDAMCIDIEDLTKPLCRRSGNACVGSCGAPAADTDAVKSFDASGGAWYRATTLSQIYSIMTENQGKKIRFVVGNTSNGIFKAWYDVYIDTKNVAELHEFRVSEAGVEVGANLTLTALIDKLTSVQADLTPNLRYLTKALVPHLEKVAGTPIRNAGCWAGNLMIQHDYPSFPSDLVPALEALGCLISVGSPEGVVRCSPVELLKMDMKGKIIISMLLPPHHDNEHYDVMRVMPRFGNAHAFVTGAFKIGFDDAGQVIGEPRIAYVGISKDFTRARRTEDFIRGKSLLETSVFRETTDVLLGEAVPDFDKIIRDDDYKKQLAVNLLYKFILRKFSSSLPAQITGMTSLSEPDVTSGKQDFETFKDKYPVTQPMPKITSRKQASGEAVFTDDLPKLDRELIGIFVPSPCAKATIESIDTSEAEKVPGVQAIYTAKDVPGKNFIITPFTKILAEGKVEYAGQPVALLLAETERIARRAGRMVKINLKDHEKPILDIHEAISKQYFHRLRMELPPGTKGDAEGAMETCEHIVEGEYVNNTQFHFYLENQSALAVPTEDGIDITCASQHPDGVQSASAAMLNLPATSVHVKVSRIGGAFGGKSNSHPLAICALGAYLSQRPVRLSCSLKNATESLGKRYPTVVKYKAGATSDGKLKSLVIDLYQDMGYAPFIPLSVFLKGSLSKMDGCYNIENMLIRGHAVKTDRQHHVAMRAPEMLPITCALEHIVDHVAKSIGLDPITVKKINLAPEGTVSLHGLPIIENPLPRAWDELMEKADVLNRQKQIELFNKDHRWIKRGLAVTPSRYAIGYGPFFQFPAFVTIYASDGTVAVAHGGVEMGQGIHTKAAQIAAKTLDIPLDLVKVKATDTLTGSNGGISAGSRTTEMVCRTVQECCKILHERLAPMRGQMRGAPWSKVVMAAQFRGIDLSVSYRHFEKSCPSQYSVFGVGAAEAEVDILTGESRILRFDGVMDNGQCMNPDVDIGQIEGALIIGLGYQLFEREVYDPETGKVITNSTWDYKPPSNLDIPMDMRITIMKDNTFSKGVLPTKAIGEPPICMSPAFLHAVKRAVENSRADRGKDTHFTLNVPGTPDRILRHCDIGRDELTFN